MFGSTRAVHFVGVGGSGMSPLAEILLRLGLQVSGSDLCASPVTARLVSLGLEFRAGHDATHVGSVDAVVRSTAVPETNPEVAEADRRGLPVVSRGELLAQLMRPREGIAVAGAHGKTTTTAMIALALERAGLDPTAVIGGRLPQFGSSARVGAGPYLVAEADESDRSFLLLSPVISVVTNIDREHLESYESFDDLCRAFERFAGGVPFYGAAVLCADDPAVRGIAGRLRRRHTSTYGLDAPDAMLTATDVSANGFGSRATVVRRTGSKPDVLGRLTLNVPGRHNVLNALAAIAVADRVGVTFDRAAAALAEFTGAERRFERKGEAGGVMVVDDYGHHPTEIAAVLHAARASGAPRVICVFQPHRFTRTATLMADFGPALALADEIVLTDIYAAGEEPIPGVTLEALAARVRSAATGDVHVVPALEDIPAHVARIARKGDLVITLGAGSIGGLGTQVLEALEACR